ncbi:MAG: hypothetical protein OSB68_04560 [Dehalococcoidia bacterium]|nr:hypothetical protein [Dehalococcoidia bacterium]
MSKSVSPSVKISHVPERGAHGKSSIYSAVDVGYLCHLAYESDNGPSILPTL